MMAHNGLAKLLEEMGELSQVAGKVLAYGTDKHPDGGMSLSHRLEDEMGDVLAAIFFVRDKLKLSDHDIFARMISKSTLYSNWDHE